jgi:hypothetical protein
LNFRNEMLSIDLLFFLFLKLMQIKVIFANNVFIFNQKSRGLQVSSPSVIKFKIGFNGI